MAILKVILSLLCLNNYVSVDTWHLPDVRRCYASLHSWSRPLREFCCRIYDMRKNIRSSSTVTYSSQSIVTEGPAIFLHGNVTVYSGNIHNSMNVIRGSGTIVEKKYDINDINSVDISGTIQLDVEQIDQANNSIIESLVIRADANLIPFVVVNTDNNNELKISQKDNINFFSVYGIRCLLKIKNIENIKQTGDTVLNIIAMKNKQLSLESSGDAKVSGSISTGKLKIKASGASEITLIGEVGNQEINASGSAKYYGAKLSAKKKLTLTDRKVHNYKLMRVTTLQELFPVQVHYGTLVAH